MGKLNWKRIAGYSFATSVGLSIGFVWGGYEFTPKNIAVLVVVMLAYSIICDFARAI